MKILITGSAGYIGSNLALLLRNEGHEPIGLDCYNDYYSPTIKRYTAEQLASQGIKTHERDLSKEPLDDLTDSVDGIVHLAAQPGISATTPWEDYHRNNIIATHRLLESSRKSEKLQLFVNVSTSSVYGLHATDTEAMPPKPASWYGATKLAAEQEALALQRGTGFPACSLRLFSVYGERERPEKLFPKLISAIMNNTEFPLFENSWDHQRSFTYVGDICQGILSTLTRREVAIGEIFNIGSDDCFTTGQAIETVEKIMGRKVKIKKLPARPGDQAATHANIGKARELLEWAPKSSLHEGLSRMVDWYQSEVHGKIDWT